jgi:hypothetical protein
MPRTQNYGQARRREVIRRQGDFQENRRPFDKCQVHPSQIHGQESNHAQHSRESRPKDRGWPAGRREAAQEANQ